MKTLGQRTVSPHKSSYSFSHYPGANMSRFSQMTGFFAVAAFMAWACTPAQAVVVIDPFDFSQSLSDDTADGTGTSGSVADVGIIGGNRGLFVEKTSPVPPPPTSGVVKALAENGGFSVSRDSGIGGHALVQWDGDGVAPAAFDPTSNLSFLLDDGVGVPGVDLTAGGGLGILVKVLIADVTGQTLTLRLYSDDASQVSVQSHVLLAAAPPASNLLFPWAGFGGTADPTRVKAITLSIEGPPGSDLSIDLIGTFVPEPATAGMFGFAAIAVMARMRRRGRRSTPIAA